MPGKVHTHKVKRVYHRKGGAIRFHGRDHSRYMPSLDRRRKAKIILRDKRKSIIRMVKTAKEKESS